MKPSHSHCPVFALHRGCRPLTAAVLALGLTLAAMGAHAAAATYEGGDGVAFDTLQLSRIVPVANVDDRILIVGFASTAENFIDIVPTSLTFNGAELTHLGGRVQNEFTDWYARTDIYYQINPAVGAGVLQGTVNAASPTGFRQEAMWGMFGMVFSGAAQQAPDLLFTNQQNPFAPSSTIGGTVTTTVDDAMLVGFTGLNGGLNNLFSTTGVTEVFDIGFSDLNFGAGYKAVGAAGNHPFTWISNGFATGVGTVAIAQIQPATVVPVPAAIWLFSAAALVLLRQPRRIV